MSTVQKEARVEVSLCTSFPPVSQALAGPIVPVAQMLVRLHAMLTGISVLSIGASAVLAPGMVSRDTWWHLPQKAQSWLCFLLAS